MLNSTQQIVYKPVLAIEQGPEVSNAPLRKNSTSAPAPDKSVVGETAPQETRPLKGKDIEIVYLKDTEQPGTLKLKGGESVPVPENRTQGTTVSSQREPIDENGTCLCSCDDCTPEMIESVCNCICCLLFCGLPLLADN